MSKTLLILRHAKSSWKEPGQDDHDRPLNNRGRRDAPKMGSLVRKNGLTPDLIISSTARRARDTAEAFAERCGYEAEIIYTSDLYLAAPDNCIAVLRELADPAQRVMIVGHNPGLEDLLIALTGASHSMPTAALAVIALAIDEWRNLRVAQVGQLQQMWRPRELE